MLAFRRIVLFVLVESLALCAFAADVEHTKVENLLMATYLYKFTDYVEWPAAVPTIPTSINIGIIDADEVAAALSTLVAAHPDQTRKMSVKILKPNESLANIQILFIGHSNSTQIRDLLAVTRDSPVLTVTAFDDALAFGSMINFIVIDGHIKFEISVSQATHCGIKISSRLLGIAQKIDTGGK
jgi:hypothetical protein